MLMSWLDREVEIPISQQRTQSVDTSGSSNSASCQEYIKSFRFTDIARRDIIVGTPSESFSMLLVIEKAVAPFVLPNCSCNSKLCKLYKETAESRSEHLREMMHLLAQRGYPLP
jgi:hypothetical protein